MLERGGGLEGEAAIGARMCNDQKRESRGVAVPRPPDVRGSVS
jgi:hypothetical protein